MSSPSAPSASASTPAAVPLSVPHASPVDSPLPPNANDQKPLVLIVIGMAGSGKTTLMQRLLAECQSRNFANYSINLDPAVPSIPYVANIDIRDTVNYKQVMKQYHLGPNGGIVTSLNLFATRFDQVLGFVEKRAPELKYVLLDTPGQIEIFTWSASGSIISESLAATFPCCIVYVMDTPRTSSPVTFMSNMMYACSIMYKSKLPFLLAFNKTDITSHQFAVNWMNDFDAFTAALKSDDSYMSSLTRSMSLVLDEFYSVLKHVGVSAVTGDGMDDFFAKLDECRDDYFASYKPHLDALRADRLKMEEEMKNDSLKRLAEDMKQSKGQQVVLDGSSNAHAITSEPSSRFHARDLEEEYEEEEEEGELNAEYESMEEKARDQAEYEEFMRRIHAQKIRDDDEVEK